MLVLGLNPGQHITIDGKTKISLHYGHANQVRLCFEAPDDVVIIRSNAKVTTRRQGQDSEAAR